MPPFRDITGQRFGRLIVLKRVANRGKYVSWLCHCDCGIEKIIESRAILRGRTKSCGCYNRDILNSASIKHGHARRQAQSVEYKTWENIITRCTNINAPSWPYYGGRGISICKRWSGENGFANFLADMGYRPSPQHSIDRIDNDESYTPGNCRWATRKVQANNTRLRKDCRLIAFNGEVKTLADWARAFAVTPQFLSNRINTMSWTIERAFTESVHRR